MAHQLADEAEAAHHRKTLWPEGVALLDDWSECCLPMFNCSAWNYNQQSPELYGLWPEAGHLWTWFESGLWSGRVRASDEL